MTPTNVDWETLCAIYDDGENELNSEETLDEYHEQNSNNNNDDRKVRLKVSEFSKGFCGTVYMTLSSSKIAFARLVKSDGSYRYFTIDNPPILKLDLLYFSCENADKEDIVPGENDNSNYIDHNKNDDWTESENDGPSNLRLTWEYYPKEWPLLDKEKYRSSLAKRCHELLRDEGSFSVCQFLEHEAISFYHGNHTGDTNAIATDEEDGDAPVTNASNSWKTYADENHPDYLLVILPPKMDQLYYPTIGSLLHPRKEAALLEEAAAKKTADASKKAVGRKTIANKKKPKPKSSSKKPPVATRVCIDNTLDFGRHALLQNWKDLYLTRCPICLEESILYSDGVVFPYCQHYCCRDCFDSYLRFKVQDLKQHRTNPFLCPVETCKRELPMTFCKPFLSESDTAAARAWYKDLKNPPAWSLDRCLLTRTCGAVGSMRRRKSVVSIDAASGKTSLQKPTLFSSDDLQYLVYCESCKNTWCELCLTRVYDDEICTVIGGSGSKNGARKPGAKTRHTVSSHKRLCNPKPILKFCSRYKAASEEIQEKVSSKYPWIESYSQFCQEDGAALEYVLNHGQRCPNCQTGVERSEGCFHMKCPTCATHFCYECGTELFPPYYGTHHCWEESGGGAGEDDDENGEDGGAYNNNNNHNNFAYYDADEQLAAALQWMQEY